MISILKGVSKCILAVSGGVDSVVLLDMLSKMPETDLIIAHFDHGIRDDSADDAIFVAELAKKYGLPYETRREELGKNVSEEKARIRRYLFLNDLVKKYDAQIITAHHADDAVETIAINIYRGTGWRGLAAMDSDVIRPLINMTKTEILDYAKNHKLSWREDSTNLHQDYLRNRLRHKMIDMEYDKKWQLLGLWSQQKSIKREIDKEIVRLIGSGPNYSRYFFTHINDNLAIECLRVATMSKLTRPQLIKALYAIKTIKPGKIYTAGSGIIMNFSSRNFVIELIK